LTCFAFTFSFSKAYDFSKYSIFLHSMSFYILCNPLRSIKHEKLCYPYLFLTCFFAAFLPISLSILSLSPSTTSSSSKLIELWVKGEWVAGVADHQSYIYCTMEKNISSQCTETDHQTHQTVIFFHVSLPLCFTALAHQTVIFFH
jgi:hypothetical protein